MKEYVLWGVPKGSPVWHEEILHECFSRTECEAAKERFEGYRSFRISEIDLAIPPDFKNTLKITKQ